MNRRKFIALMGGGIVLAAGSAAGYAVTRQPKDALRPWANAGGSYNDPRKRALSYAILAPNPHNRQPWMIDLSRPDQIVLYVDTDRLLPHTDPFSRQITIGLGCFLELLRMAAANDGFDVVYDLFPEGEDPTRLDQRPVAIATFIKDPQIKRDALFAHVFERRSLKEPYDINRPVKSDVLSRIEASVEKGTGSTNDPLRLKALRKLTHDAMRIEVETPHTYKESVDLFRIGHTEIEANPDGIDFSGPFFEAMHLTGLFTREQTLDTSSTAYAQGLELVLKSADTAMGFVWLVTPGNTRIDQIHAGRDWLRINLATTAEGVGTQPMSQALQEYPEMTELYEKIHAMLAPEGGTVQMLGRLGYAAPVPPSPRWPLDAKIIKDAV